MKILVLIMAHYTQDEVFENYKKIWDKIIQISKSQNLPFKFLFLYSDENIKEEYIISDDCLISKCVENYWDSLLIKTINGFDFFISNDFDLVFKTNLSTVINLENFNNYCLETYKSDRYVYDGLIGQYNNFKFVSGAGMLLNKKSVNLILDNKSQVSKDWTDDIFFGYILNHKNNIIPTYGELKRYDLIYSGQSIDISQVGSATHIRVKVREGNKDVEFINRVYEILYE